MTAAVRAYQARASICRELSFRRNVFRVARAKPWLGGFSATEKKMSLGRIAVVATFACVTLVSVGWSEQGGVSLSIASAQARTHHAQASRHMAASHQHGRRMVRRGYGPNPVAAGAGLAAGAIDTAGALAFGAIGTAGAIAAAPFGGPAPGWGGYYSPSSWGDHECRPGYAGCRPYASKDWGYH